MPEHQTSSEWRPLHNCRGSVPAVLCLAAILANSGCWFRKSPRVFTPPPAPPQTATAEEKPAPLLQPPGDEEVEANLPGPPELHDANMPQLPAPPKPTPARRPPVAVAPKPAPAPAADTPAPPKLGQIFTADERREYNRVLDESLERVKKALDTLAARSLTADQTDALERIRSFQKQAEQAREQDLVTAVSLARRADLLAKDLLERLP